MEIDVTEYKEFKELLSLISEDDPLFIKDEGTTKYVILPINTYDKVEDILQAVNGVITPEIRVISPNDEQVQLSYEEYERVKAMIMDAVEKTFKPKAEKLN